MQEHDERRSAPRVRLVPSVAASLSEIPVSIVDVSTSGAKLQHDTTFPYAHDKPFVLSFFFEGEQFVFFCTVARSRVDRHPLSRRMVFTSGIQFEQLDPAEEHRLRHLTETVAFNASIRHLRDM